MAQVGGREHELARGEEPVAWTANGLITQRGNEIRLRARSGRLIRVVARGHSPVQDGADHTVVFVSRSGAVVRTDGLHVWQLARGFRSSAWVQLLGSRIIDVMSGPRSVFLRADGSRLGMTAPAEAAAMGAVVALPSNRGVVYVVRRYRPGNDPGVNRVYLLRPHARARLLYTRRIPWLSCGEYTSLSYTAGRILYADDEGPTAVLDPSGRTRPVDLTRALHLLKPRRNYLQQLSADWASSWR